MFFQKAVESVSFDAQLYFTTRQLWHEINRRLWRKRRMGLLALPIIPFFLLVVLAGSGLAESEPRFFTTLAVMAVVVTAAWIYYVKFRLKPRLLMSGDQLEEALRRWSAVHGKLERLLAKEDVSIGPRGQEADLTDYGFERLIITERMITAAMLLANRLHLEKKCAILSAEDLTSTGAQLILKMVTSSPQLRVLVVHDASIAGCDLPRRVQKEAWFRAEDFELVDLGLRPGQARKLNLFTQTRPGATDAAEIFGAEQLSEEEIEWLSKGHYSELEGLRPRALLQAVSRGLASTGEADLAEEPIFSEGIFWVESFG